MPSGIDKEVLNEQKEVIFSTNAMYTRLMDAKNSNQAITHARELIKLNRFKYKTFKLENNIENFIRTENVTSGASKARKITYV